MRQEQKLTPQLIQSMTILQKPVADLEAFVNESLESNAALDVVEQQPDVSEDASSHGVEGPATDGENSFARLARYSSDYDMEASDRAPHFARRVVDQSGRDPKMGALANTAGRPIDLHDYLLSQWVLVDLDDEVRRAGDAIIEHIDLDGTLRVRLEEIAISVRPPLILETLEQALTKVHELDPAGVGARDVRECLLLQLDRIPGENQVERVLIESHLDDIAHNRLPAVAKATGFSIDEINEAIHVMRTSLSPHPGFLVGDHSVPIIRPDVVVNYAETGNGLTVRLTRGNVPDLCVRDEVVKLAKSKDNDREARDFARKQVESASAIIDAVKFRQERVMEISRLIVEKQRDFFDVGPQALKVLRMSDMAAELGCDPSTISRTVADKYMQTPRGIYPLRYFFTGGMETADGESVGWDRVKTRVKELVEAEDKKNPLNDEQLANILKEEHTEISRRTVAKYRQQLDIPAARQRRIFS